MSEKMYVSQEDLLILIAKAYDQQRGDLVMEFVSGALDTANKIVADLKKENEELKKQLDKINSNPQWDH